LSIAWKVLSKLDLSEIFPCVMLDAILLVFQSEIYHRLGHTHSASCTLTWE